MTDYDIDPGGVESALRRTAAAATPLEGQRKAFFQSLEQAVKASRSNIVAEALARYAAHTEPRLTGMYSRIGRALEHTHKAAGFYIQADQEMGERARRYERKAAAAQRAALDAPGANGRYK
ncbi:DUF6507 family protein [Spirillospora sp. CA-255316]